MFTPSHPPIPQLMALTGRAHRDKSHTYMQYNARSTDGDEDEKGYQGLIIKEKKGGERSKTNGLVSHRSKYSDISQSRVSVTDQ
jgi:hypothetical protein